MTGALLGVFLAVVGCAGGVHAQEPVLLPSTYQHALRSELNGATYQLTVVLPEGYNDQSDRRYPVFYVMDGNRWASLLAVILPRFTQNAGYPPIIVVGVDYPGRSGRYQDYGPVSQRYFPVPEERGYANFMRVLKREIIPLVDASYRTDPQDRGIGGHSMGGLFASYALLHDADSFQRFWISSPSLFYDDEILFEDFEAFARQPINKPVYVFTDVGEDELPTMIGTLERFTQRVQEAQPGRIVLRMMVVPETDHATVVPSVFAPALQHLYMYRPEVTPAAGDLSRFAGSYEQPDGTLIKFVTDGRSLLYTDSSIDYANGALVRLTASASNRFFLRGSAAEYEFPQGEEAADRVHITQGRSGATLDALRVSPADGPSAVRRVRLGAP